MAHFSLPNSIYYDYIWLYHDYIFSLFFPVLSHFWPTVWCRPCTLGSFFSSDFWSFYWTVHFFRIWLSGIIAITNNSGDWASRWKIPPWIFTSIKLFSPTFCSTLQFSFVCSINFLNSPDIVYIYDYYYYYSKRVFPISYADCLSLESEWQQVLSSLQDSSQYSDRFQQCCSLDCLKLSSYFQVHQSLYQSFVSRAPITIGINVTFMFHKLFNSQERSSYLSFYSLSFNFTLWSAGTVKSVILQVFF